MDDPYWESKKTSFDKKLSKDNLAISHMQCIFLTGGPLQNDTFRYDNVSHNREEQQAQLKEFILDYKAEYTEKNTVDALGFSAQMFSFVTFLDLPDFRFCFKCSSSCFRFSAELVSSRIMMRLASSPILPRWLWPCLAFF